MKFYYLQDEYEGWDHYLFMDKRTALNFAEAHETYTKDDIQLLEFRGNKRGIYYAMQDIARIVGTSFIYPGEGRQHEI
jgi:hypothetical protein